MIKNFNVFSINEESSIRFPNDLEYWKKKGKKGKDVIIYTHDDMDGIFSAIAMKEYLIRRGFNIRGYAIISYTDGWKIFKIDKEYINVSVDYAEDHPDLDLYIDHHMEEGDLYKKSEYSIKMRSDSCYGLITRILGMPTDKNILDVISMIDAAKYDEYKVDIKTILNFNLKDIMKEKNPRLVFAGAFNQLIKRSDYQTIIEVIHNGSLSILKIFRLFQLIYPINNLKVTRGIDKQIIRKTLLTGEDEDLIGDLKEVPEFVPDSLNRIKKMITRTSGVYDKPFIYNLEDFKNFYWDDGENKFKFDGFAVIKNLVYIPVGTWANALRARALIESVLKKRDKYIQFILLDYGASLQIAAYKNIDDMENLPVLRGGEILDDLDKYTRFLLNFVLPRQFNFKYAGAKAGGHKGIGNLSNILGKCEKEPFHGIKFMDLMKNWIIHDITGIKWKLNLIWNENPPEDRKPKEKVINQKFMWVDDIRKINL
jgi:hypothetical protein